MAYNYDELYESTPDALGQPTLVFVDFFNGLTGKGLRVLDVGCGQGRDALFIARLGHSVVGVDLSAHGIADMVAAARREALPIEGIAADIIGFTPEGDFDVVLIDRTLHMLPENARHETLARLIQHVVAGGWLLISDETSNMAGIEAVIAADHANWTVHLRPRGNLFLLRD